MSADPPVDASADAPLHVSVMPEEILHWLAPAAGGRFADGTLGAGGHSRAIAERVGPRGVVLATDRDPAAVAVAGRRLADLPIRAVVADFADLADVLREQGIGLLDGIVLDLGLSSDQLADASRGFSFNATGELDLRFDPSLGEPAWRLVQRLSEVDLANTIYRYGEERFSRRIARRIVAARSAGPLRSAADFASLVRGAVPRGPDARRLDPATRTFQALRIAVNDELGSLERALALARCAPTRRTTGDYQLPFLGRSTCEVGVPARYAT